MQRPCLIAGCLAAACAAFAWGEPSAAADLSFREQLTFGLNRQWADLSIMRANSLLITTSSPYENLFRMLAAGRFDAIPH